MTVPYVRPFEDRLSAIDEKHERIWGERTIINGPAELHPFGNHSVLFLPLSFRDLADYQRSLWGQVIGFYIIRGGTVQWKP